MIYSYERFVGKYEVKSSVGRKSHSWKNNIKINLKNEATVWTGLKWLRMESIGNEHRDDLSGFITCRELLDRISDHQLPKQDSVSCS